MELAVLLAKARRAVERFPDFAQVELDIGNDQSEPRSVIIGEMADDAWKHAGYLLFGKADG